MEPAERLEQFVLLLAVAVLRVEEAAEHEDHRLLRAGLHARPHRRVQHVGRRVPERADPAGGELGVGEVPGVRRDELAAGHPTVERRLYLGQPLRQPRRERERLHAGDTDTAADVIATRRHLAGEVHVVVAERRPVDRLAQVRAVDEHVEVGTRLARLRVVDDAAVTAG